jgi:hypothetical protein
LLLCILFSLLDIIKPFQIKGGINNLGIEEFRYLGIKEFVIQGFRNLGI